MRTVLVPSRWLLFALLCGGCPSTMQSVQDCSSDGDCPAGNHCTTTGICEPGGGADLAAPGDQGPMPDMLIQSALAPDWARRFGAPGTDVASGVAADSNGEVGLVANVSGAFDLDGTLINKTDLLLARLNGNTGTRQFSQDIATYTAMPVDTRPNLKVAFDAAGDTIVVGSFLTTLDCGDGKVLRATSSYDVFVAKYRRIDGVCLWSRSFGSGQDDIAYGVAINSKKEIYLTGSFNSSISFSGTTYQSAGKTDIFVAQFSMDGLPLRFRRWGSPDNDAGLGLSLDSTGNVVLVGSFSKGMVLGPDILPNSGETDIFVTKLGAALDTVAWVHSYGGQFSDAPQDVAVASTGEIAVAGSFQWIGEFNRDSPGTMTVTSAGDYDGFVLLLNGDGATRWVRGFGGPRTDLGRAVAIDKIGDVLVGGSITDRARFENTELVAQKRDLSFARYSRGSGAITWVERYGGAGDDDVWSVAAVPGGGAVIAGGTTSDSLTFGTKTLAGAGMGDAFVARFVPAAPPTR